MKSKFILILIILFSFNALNAQVKNGKNKNLAKLFTEAAWEDLAFKTERMAQQKYAEDPEVLLYLAYSYSKVFLLCLEKPELLDKYPEYINSYQFAINYSQQAKRKDKKTKIFFPDNDNLLEEIVIVGYYYIDDYVNVKKKYPKANSLLNKLQKVYSDDNILFLRAVLFAMTNNDLQAREIFDSVANKVQGAKKNKTAFYYIEACDYYTHFLMNKEVPEIDTARNFVNNALKIYPDNEVLLYLAEYVENPFTEKIKPQNQLRVAILKDINSMLEGNDADDADDNPRIKRKKKNEDSDD